MIYNGNPNEGSTYNLPTTIRKDGTTTVSEEIIFEDREKQKKTKTGG